MSVKIQSLKLRCKPQGKAKLDISHIGAGFHINRANGKLGSILCHFCPTYGKQQKNVETLSKNELLSVLVFMVWQRKVTQNESSPPSPFYIFMLHPLFQPVSSPPVFIYQSKKKKSLSFFYQLGVVFFFFSSQCVDQPNNTFRTHRESYVFYWWKPNIFIYRWLLYYSY